MIELDWSKVDIHNPRLDELFEEGNIILKNMEKLLERIESGNSSLNYLEQEFYKGELAEEIEERRILQDLLERAITMRNLTQ